MGLLKSSKAKGTILTELRKIERMDLLILDDFGLQPFDATARMNLLDVIEDRYGKKSTFITSQISVKEWYLIHKNGCFLLHKYKELFISNEDRIFFVSTNILFINKASWDNIHFPLSQQYKLTLFLSKWNKCDDLLAL